MYCNKCGASLGVDDKFCRSCGASTDALNGTGKKDLWLDPSPPPAPEKRPSVQLAEKPKDSTLVTFLKKWAYRLVILIAASMAMVIAKPLGKILVEKYQESKIWEDAPKEIERTKSTMGLPKRLDDFTVMNDVYIKGHELHYEYIVNDVDISNNTNQQLSILAKNAFNMALCENALITKYDGISIYTYKFPNGTLTYKFTKVDCRSSH